MPPLFTGMRKAEGRHTGHGRQSILMLSLQGVYRVAPETQVVVEDLTLREEPRFSFPRNMLHQRPEALMACGFKSLERLSTIDLPIRASQCTLAQTPLSAERKPV